MFGDVWEWTASDFRGYPDFVSFPYREYSEVFFGPDYKVLRGGSWATHPSAMRPSFRNWDYPIRRQIFSGFRCARRRLTSCAVTLPTSVPPSRSTNCSSASRTRSATRRARPQHQVSGETNPDGWGVGWYWNGDEAPSRHRTVTPIWDDAPFAEQSADHRERRVPRRGPPRVARGHHRPERQRALHLGAVALLAQRRGRRVPQGRRRSAAREAEPGAPRRHRGRLRLRGAVRPDPRPARRGRLARRRPREVVDDRHRAHQGPPQHAAHRRTPARGHRGTATRCSSADDSGVGAARRRCRLERGARPLRSSSAAAVPAATAQPKITPL